MPGHGYVEVEVRLLRQGHGEDSSGVPGSGFAVEATRTLRIEEVEAREATLRNDVMRAEQIGERVVAALHEVLDEDEQGELRQRWARATERMSAEQMRAALEVLEA